MSPTNQDRASAGDLSEATPSNLPEGYKQEGNVIICPSGLRWTMNLGNGFDVSNRGQTLHISFDEFAVVDRYVLHSKMGATSTT